MTDPLDIRVEIYVDEWVDISQDVARRQDLMVVRGRQNEGRQVDPSTLNLRIRNNGTYTPRNPASPYYGRIGRNTPIRVTVEGYRRFAGEVTSWPSRWDTSGRDVYVPIQASGVMRRLNQGRNARSSLRLTTERPGVDWSSGPHSGQPIVPVGYWPLEDGENSTTGASGLQLGQPAFVSLRYPLTPDGGSRVEWAADEDLPGTTVAPRIVRGALSCPVPGVPGLPARWVIAFAARTVPSISGIMMLARCTAPGATKFEVHVLPPTASAPLGVFLVTDSPTPFELMTHAFPYGTFDDQWHHYAVTAEMFGPDIFWGLWVDGVQVDDFAQAATTLRAPHQIDGWAPLDDGESLSWSHVAVYGPGPVTDVPINKLARAALGYPGEPAGRRIERLCLEDGITLGVIGALSQTQAMGPQRSGTILDLLRECAEADQGILYEPTQVNRSLGDFELGTTDGWQGGGSPAPTVEVSTARAFSGAASLRIIWLGGTGLQLIQRVTAQTIFVPGLEYTASMWVWVPAGSPAVVIVVAGVQIGDTSSVTDAWQQINVAWLATDITQSIQLWAVGTTSFGQQVWVDHIRITSDHPGLAYRTLESQYNRATTITLDYAQRQVAPPLEPSPDDQLVRNDVTVERKGGSSARVVADSVSWGPLNTLAPPYGVGVYDDRKTVNVHTDEQAGHHAGWAVHIGTWDEERYPVVRVNLAKRPDLIPAAVAVDVGHRLSIINPPPWLPPDAIDQIVHGYTETINTRRWEVEFNTTPSGPYRIGVLDQEEGRLDSDYTTLLNDIDTTQVSIDIVVQSGRAPWANSTSHPGEFPFAWRIGGEVMTVTALTAPVSLVQTATVVRSVNGVTKGHSSGDAVRLAYPSVIGL